MPGLSVFFPAYNDAGTIASLVITAVQVAGTLTPDFEVIVDQRLQPGRHARAFSTSSPASIPIASASSTTLNRGYGGALRTGFATASKDFVFYTDGDGQYDPSEMKVLWEKMRTMSIG